MSGSIKNIFEVDKWFRRTAWKHNLSASYEISSQVSKWRRTQLLAIKMCFTAVSSLLNTCCWISCSSPHALRNCRVPRLLPQCWWGMGTSSSVLPWAAFAGGATSSKLKPWRLRRHLWPKEGIFALCWRCLANSLVLEKSAGAVRHNLGTAVVLLIIKDFLWTG